MSVYMRGYDRGQERGRAEVGLSGDHAPSDAGKSLPWMMMVGKPMVKLSGISPGQLHPELALTLVGVTIFGLFRASLYAPRSFLVGV